tara:strand:- start:319 stop:1374 length:1056 start_codon:yes stop_codon:yes gene_type:complete
MTKARDLAGFSTGSITNTTADGLILKGDGSSTDVVIKNGADATVATVADGTTDLSKVLARGSIDVGNASGVSAPLAKGAAGTVLTSDGTDLSYAAVPAGGTSSVVYPSNWASPTASYTSSGTYSKGSLSDDDYVWIYILSAGQGAGSISGGGAAFGGAGGSAMLLYGKAGTFNGGTYVVAASTAGNSAGSDPATTANTSSFTLSSANGSTVFTPPVSGDTTTARVLGVFGQSNDAISLASHDDYTLNGAIADPYAWNDGGLPSGVSYRYFAPGKAWNGNTNVEHCIFGGGNGAGYYQTSKVAGTSEFAGAGGADASQGAAGTAPGGGGGASRSGSNAGGAGAAGIIKVYNV